VAALQAARREVLGRGFDGVLLVADGAWVVVNATDYRNSIMALFTCS
jgi:hypothetical protein